MCAYLSKSENLCPVARKKAEKHFQLCLAELEISELPEDSNKIFKRNMVDLYIDRPNLTNLAASLLVLINFLL